MNLQYSWKMLSTKEELSFDKVIGYLLHKENGVVLLDGYSWCGKTTILRKLEEASQRPVCRLSYETVVDKIVHVLRKHENCYEYLCDIAEDGAIIGIEDVDYLSGKDATQEYVVEMIQLAAKKHLIVLTGNNVCKRVPVLYQMGIQEVFQAQPLREIERMCLDLDFDRDRAKRLLPLIDVNQEFVDLEHGVTTILLDWAAIWSNVSMVKLLLEYGADPNRIFEDGEASTLWNLQYADSNAPEANRRRLEIVKLLLESGADPHLKLNGDDTLNWATFCHIELDEGEQWDYREEYICLLEAFEK